MNSFTYDQLLALDMNKFYIISVQAMTSKTFEFFRSIMHEQLNRLPPDQRPKSIVLMQSPRLGLSMVSESDEPKAVCLFTADQLRQIESWMFTNAQQIVGTFGNTEYKDQLVREIFTQIKKAHADLERFK